MKIKSTNLNICNLNLLLAKLLRPSAGGAVLCPFYQKVEAPPSNPRVPARKESEKENRKKRTKKRKKKNTTTTRQGKGKYAFLVFENEYFSDRWRILRSVFLFSEVELPSFARRSDLDLVFIKFKSSLAIHTSKPTFM